MDPLAHPRVTYVGRDAAGLRRALQAHCRALLEAGEPSDAILVLASSSARDEWHAALGEDRALRALRVMSPSRWIQRELALWWPLVEPRLGPGTAREEPLFAEIDLAQYLFVKATGAFRKASGCLDEARTLPYLQTIQMLDSLARAAEHGLDPTGIGRRLASAAASPAEAALMLATQDCLDRYRDLLLRNRILDHGLQLWVYGEHLLPQEAYRAVLARQVAHLLAEDLDEQVPRVHAMVNAIGSQARTIAYAMHPPGTSGGLREYTGADPEGALELSATTEQVFLPGTPLFEPLGELLHASLVADAVSATCPSPLCERIVLDLDLPDPAAMLDACVRHVRGCLAEGHSEGDVAIVAPVVDAMLIWGLRDRLAPVPLYVSAGTNRLVDYRPVRMLLTVARLSHPGWGVETAPDDRLELLEVVTGLDPLTLSPLVRSALPFAHGLPASEEVAARGGAAAGERFRRFLDWLGHDRSALALPVFFREAFVGCWAPARPEPAPDTPEHEVWQRELSQIGQLIETCEKFMAVVAPLSGIESPQAVSRQFLAFLYGGTIAERPFYKREPYARSIVLATAQYFAERGHPVKVQVWLDASSERWWKTDRRELTNGRVLSRRWPGGVYDDETDERDMDTKLARVLRALTAKVESRLVILGSQLDMEGREQAGRLPYHLIRTGTAPMESLV